jgi:transposase
MANVLNNEKKQQILALGQLGWSLRRIQKATRVRRETISTYLKAAGVGVWPPGGWGRQTGSKPAIGVTTDFGAELSAPRPEMQGLIPGDSAKPAIGVTTGFGVELRGPRAGNPGRNPLASACEPFQEAIDLGLSRGRNAMAIWQDLVSDYGFTSSYQSVKRYIHKRRGSQLPQATAVILTAPGEEAQVDYGTGPMVRDPHRGKYRRTRLFVMTLGYSRKSVRLLVFHSSSRIWAELHEKAFRRLGGSTRIVVLDNLREGVLVPDIYDPALNPLYRDVLAHYGAVAMPCRIQDPDRKGKVESGVGHAQKTPLKGLRFESLEQAQAYLDGWEARWADTRIHGTTKRQVAVMFAEEKPALLPLPIEPFRYYQYGDRTVHLDSCVEVEAAYYSAKAGSCYASTYVRNVAGIASKKKTTLLALQFACRKCYGAPSGQARRWVRSATLSIGTKEKLAFVASWACSRWPRSSVQPPRKMPARRPWKWECMNTAWCAAIWNAVRS